jgi:hypothetical protein
VDFNIGLGFVVKFTFILVSNHDQRILVGGTFQEPTADLLWLYHPAFIGGMRDGTFIANLNASLLVFVSQIAKIIIGGVTLILLRNN